MQRKILCIVLVFVMINLLPSIQAAEDTAVSAMHFVDENGEKLLYNREDESGYPYIKVSGSGGSAIVSTILYNGSGDAISFDADVWNYKSGEDEYKGSRILVPEGYRAKLIIIGKESIKPLNLSYTYPFMYQGSGYVSLNEYDTEIKDAITFMDSKLSREILDFYSTLYDRDTGMFYACTSGRETYGIHPNIECTSQILNFVQESGSVHPRDYLSDEQKGKMIAFMEEMYNPDDGKFYHPDAPKGVATTGRISRDQEWAKKYILPYAGTSYSAFVSNYNEKYGVSATLSADEADDFQRIAACTSVEEYVMFLEEKWSANEAAGNSPYKLGDSFGGYGSEAAKKGSEYYKAHCNFLIDKQNPETGLWGDGADYKAVSAAMKFAGCFKGAGVSYRYYDKMIDSCIKALLSDEDVEYIVYIWNPISAMKQAKQSFTAVGEKVPYDFMEKIVKNAPDIIYAAMEKIQKFKKPDGGYSYEPHQATSAIQSMVCGLGLYESDVDGTGKLRGVREDMYTLLSLKNTDFLTKEDVQGFFDKINTMAPNVKNTNKTYQNDFEHYDTTLSDKPDEWMEHVYNSSGSVKAVKDPIEGDKCIRFKGIKGSRTSGKIGGFSLMSEQGQVQTIEFDIMVKNNSAKPIYYINLGNNAVRLYVYGSGSTVSLAHVNGATGWGKTFKTCDVNKWYKVRVEYLPKGIDDTNVKIYVDGEVQSGVSSYYGYGLSPQIKPKKSIAGFSVTGLNDMTGGEVYIDNLRAYVK